MRILFTTYPDKTIFHAMVPLAWALRTAGHEVRVAVQPKFADVVTQAGLTAVSVGRDPSTWRLAELNIEQVEAERAGLPAPYDAAVDPAAVDWEKMRDGYATLVEQWHQLDNFPMIAGLVDFARGWRPDLVVWESNTYAGGIAAEACGAAHARLVWSVDVFGVAREHYLRLKAERPKDDRADPMADWLGPYARKYGFDFTEDLLTGQFTVHQLPASLSMDAGLDYLPMRYVPYGGVAAVPKWLWAAPERPRVALTLGTTATDRYAGYAADVRDILDSLADLDVEVVATIAESAQRKLTSVPGNARIVSWVPLHALVPSCSVIINHAGPGTFLTSALHGVPQLTVPWDFDEPELARRAAAQGGSLTIRADRATGESVRAGVLRLLDEPGFGERAVSLRDEIRALPTPNQLVPRLEELTAKRRVADR
ncbi:activator-dependent family glycosyltransferase [Streptosporangium sp. NPDC049644]|uniref:activator-dependent family glycosyltransferase n=1 Tax=Streptosporangium sp. NPDC049644 TaxID=3155507 RepID=UPI003412DB33